MPSCADGANRLERNPLRSRFVTDEVPVEAMAMLRASGAVSTAWRTRNKKAKNKESASRHETLPISELESAKDVHRLNWRVG